MTRPTRSCWVLAVAALSLAGVIAGCSGERLPTPSVPVTIEASHAVPNRCGDAAARACRSDRDCARGVTCASVITTNAPSYGRDGGHTLRIGNYVLWIFGDTFTPAGMLSSTAGWSRLSDPQALDEATDSDGLPIQFFPFTDEEIEFNRAHADVPACCRVRTGCSPEQRYCNCPDATDCAERIALWPGDGLAAGDAGRLFYEKFVIGAQPYDFRRVGVGMAEIRAGAPQAVRSLDADGEPQLLFGPDDPGFARGLVVADKPPRFYVYANVNRQGCAVDVVAGRVVTDAVADRSRYEFWNGSGWTSDMNLSQPILEAIPGGLGSVMWNDHLGRYLSAWSDICTGGKVVMLRTAPRPEGPWSSALSVDLGALGATRDAYYGLLHPEFGTARSLLLSFFQPVDDVYGQIRLVRLVLG
jgi:hypothetical protein